MNWKQFAKKNSNWIKAEKSNSLKSVLFTDRRGNGENIFIITKNRYILMNFLYMSRKRQDKIVRFLNQGPKKWFEKPLYNIIIGRCNAIDKDYAITAYRKCVHGYEINDDANIHGMFEDEFEFTEKEIDDLKSWLPENMQKIVDLGKVEVKDNGD